MPRAAVDQVLLYLLPRLIPQEINYLPYILEEKINSQRG